MKAFKKTQAALDTAARVEIAIDSFGREQMYELIRQIPSASPAGMTRASDDALRGALRTYIRLGRLTAEAVIQKRWPIIEGNGE